MSCCWNNDCYTIDIDACPCPPPVPCLPPMSKLAAFVNGGGSNPYDQCGQCQDHCGSGSGACASPPCQTIKVCFPRVPDKCAPPVFIPGPERPPRLKNVDVMEELCYFNKSWNPRRPVDCYNSCNGCMQYICTTCEPDQCSSDPVKYSRRQRFSYENEKPCCCPQIQCTVEQVPPWTFDIKPNQNCCGGRSNQGNGHQNNYCCGGGAGGANRFQPYRTNSFDETPVGKNPVQKPKCRCCCHSNNSAATHKDQNKECESKFPKTSGVYHFNRNKLEFVPHVPEVKVFQNPGHAGRGRQQGDEEDDDEEDSEEPEPEIIVQPIIHQMMMPCQQPCHPPCPYPYPIYIPCPCPQPPPPPPPCYNPCGGMGMMGGGMLGMGGGLSCCGPSNGVVPMCIPMCNQYGLTCGPTQAYSKKKSKKSSKKKEAKKKKKKKRKQEEEPEEDEEPEYSNESIQSADTDIMTRDRPPEDSPTSTAEPATTPATTAVTSSPPYTPETSPSQPEPTASKTTLRLQSTVRVKVKDRNSDTTDTSKDN